MSRTPLMRSETRPGELATVVTVAWAGSGEGAAAGAANSARATNVVRVGPSRNTASMRLMPIDALHTMCRFLDAKDLMAFAATSRRHARAAQHPDLWRDLILGEFKPPAEQISRERFLSRAQRLRERALMSFRRLPSFRSPRPLDPEEARARALVKEDDVLRDAHEARAAIGAAAAVTATEPAGSSAATGVVAVGAAAASAGNSETAAPTTLTGAFAVVEDETSAVFREVLSQQDRLYGHWLRNDFRARWQRRRAIHESVVGWHEDFLERDRAWRRGRTVALGLSTVQIGAVALAPLALLLFVVLVCLKLDGSLEDDTSWVVVCSPLILAGLLIAVVVSLYATTVVWTGCQGNKVSMCRGQTAAALPCSRLTAGLSWLCCCGWGTPDEDNEELRCEMNTATLTRFSFVGFLPTLLLTFILPILKANGGLEDVTWGTVLVPLPLALCFGWLPFGFCLAASLNDRYPEHYLPGLLPVFASLAVSGILFALYMDDKVSSLFYVFFPVLVPATVVFLALKYLLIFFCVQGNDGHGEITIGSMIVGGGFVTVVALIFSIITPIMRGLEYFTSSWFSAFAPLLVVLGVGTLAMWFLLYVLGQHDTFFLDESPFSFYNRPEENHGPAANERRADAADPGVGFGGVTVAPTVIPNEMPDPGQHHWRRVVDGILMRPEIEPELIVEPEEPNVVEEIEDIEAGGEESDDESDGENPGGGAHPGGAADPNVVVENDDDD